MAEKDQKYAECGTKAVRFDKLYQALLRGDDRKVYMAEARAAVRDAGIKQEE
jgi:uncharacterized protein (DUF1697 family)